MASVHEVVADIKRNGYDFEFGKYFSVGGKEISKSYGKMLGYTAILVVVPILIVFFVVGGMAFFGPNANFERGGGFSVGTQNPILSVLITTVFNVLIIGPAYAGFYTYLKDARRTGNREFGKFFKGWKFIGPLAIATVITTIGNSLVTLPLGLWSQEILHEAMMKRLDDDYPFAMMEVMGTIYGIMAIQYLFMLFYLTFFTFANRFIVVTGCTGLEAIKYSFIVIGKKYFWFILFNLVLAIIVGSGILVCGIGILFTIPLGLCWSYGAFDEIIVQRMEVEGEESQEITTDEDLLDI